MKLQGIQGITYSYLRAAQPTQTPVTTNPAPSAPAAKIAFGRGEQKVYTELAEQIAKLCAYKEINGAPIKDNRDCSDYVLNQIEAFEKQHRVKVKIKINADQSTPASKSIATITTCRQWFPLISDSVKVEFMHPEYVQRMNVKSNSIAGNTALEQVGIPLIKAIKSSINGALGTVVYH